MAEEERTVIGSHTTDKAPEDQSWSAPTLGDFTEETDFSALSEGERRRIATHAAWTANMPPETFGDIKLFHHEAGRSGMGAVVWRGVAAAMAVLLGGRGGVDVPSGDRRGIYNHLAGHYEQFDKEPPAFREEPDDRAVETRMFDLEQVDLRVLREDGEPPKIVGHGAVFNKWSLPIAGYFRERILPGAFAKTLKESKDIPSLYNHDPNMVLGRTSNKTLELREDEVGLWFQVTPPDTTYARDLLVNIERGNVTGNSFGFIAVKDRWSGEDSGGEGSMQREVMEARLLDIGPVTFPAYPQTDVAVRELLDWEQRIGRRLQGKRLEQLGAVVSSLQEAASALEALISWAKEGDSDEDSDRSAPSRPGTGHLANIGDLRRRVDARLLEP